MSSCARGSSAIRISFWKRESLGLSMSNVVPFPTSRRVPAKAIPREQFEQFAELARDVVERIVALLDGEAEEAITQANGLPPEV